MAWRTGAMSNQIDQVELDDVLDAFVAAGAPSLRDFVQRYPQFEAELTEFAVSWQLSEALPASPDVEQVTDATIVDRGLRAVRELLSTRRFQIDPGGISVGSGA